MDLPERLLVDESKVAVDDERVPDVAPALKGTNRE